MHYAGFWIRLAAILLDVGVSLPVLGLMYWLEQTTRLAGLYWLLPELVLMVWFEVYLVVRFGGTPGKLIMRIRIVMLDESAVSARAAALRYSVRFVLTALLGAAFVLASLAMTDDSFFAMSALAGARRLSELTPTWSQPVWWFGQVWMWAEFATMMLNGKRRAIHDLMAGTVVVRLVDAPYREVPVD